MKLRLDTVTTDPANMASLFLQVISTFFLIIFIFTGKNPRLIWMLCNYFLKFNIFYDEYFYGTIFIIFALVTEI